MFGCQSIDPLLIEIFVDSPGEVIPSPTSRERADVSTQTLLQASQLQQQQTSSSADEMMSSVQLTPPPTATTLSTLSPVESISGSSGTLQCSTSPHQQRITPIIVPPGPNNNGHNSNLGNSNTSYNFYFPYSGQFSVSSTYPVQQQPPTASGTSGTYVSQAGIFDSTVHAASATDVTNNFRYL